MVFVVKSHPNVWNARMFQHASHFVQSHDFRPSKSDFNGIGIENTSYFLNCLVSEIELRIQSFHHHYAQRFLHDVNDIILDSLPLRRPFTFLNMWLQRHDLLVLGGRRFLQDKSPEGGYTFVQVACLRIVLNFESSLWKNRLTCRT